MYCGSKKVKGKVVYGVTIYSDRGKVLYSKVTKEEPSELKFQASLASLAWGVKRLGQQVMNKELPEEKVLIFINNVNIYSWFEKGVAPAPYLITFSDMQLDLAFVLNDIEIIQGVGASNRVLFKDSKKQDKLERATDMFAIAE